jgi:hypothetical protein
VPEEMHATRLLDTGLHDVLANKLREVVGLQRLADAAEEQMAIVRLDGQIHAGFVEVLPDPQRRTLDRRRLLLPA